ncbi:hypothetical protein ON010_g12330 [Phytophthora cinnamomi]|nr:hypothetical protein ON010_g12330 [Phytophthora cinnamomi]
MRGGRAGAAGAPPTSDAGGARHKKHASKKAKKEEKKRHKKHKHNRDKEPLDEAEGEELAATSEPEAGIEDKVEQKKEPEKASIDARSFFEQLQKQEAAKEPVGTVHARGLPAPVSATAISTSDKWECSKAGCGHMNSKHAPACNKCGAMKRLTEWR